MLRGIVDRGFEREECHCGKGRTDVGEKFERNASVGAMGRTVGL